MRADPSDRWILLSRARSLLARGGVCVVHRSLRFARSPLVPSSPPSLLRLALSPRRCEQSAEARPASAEREAARHPRDEETRHARASDVARERERRGNAPARGGARRITHTPAQRQTDTAAAQHTTLTLDAERNSSAHRRRTPHSDGPSRPLPSPPLSVAAAAMPVAMRLMRMGTTHHPVYRISIGDSRKRPTAKFIEHIGTYNPTPDKMGHKQVTRHSTQQRRTHQGRCECVPPLASILMCACAGASV